LIVAIHKAIVASFSDADWRTLGYQTDTRAWIEKHPRLLRSLSIGDDDYSGYVLSEIEKMLKMDLENIKSFWKRRASSLGFRRTNRVCTRNS
jgi:hypothetical protein